GFTGFSQASPQAKTSSQVLSGIWMRRTRILTTIGPASADQSTIGALLAAGTDAFRLNFSHGTPEMHAETCRHIRDIASAAGRDIGIMQDLSGPKIRIGEV